MLHQSPLLCLFGDLSGKYCIPYNLLINSMMVYCIDANALPIIDSQFMNARDLKQRKK